MRLNNNICVYYDRTYLLNELYSFSRKNFSHFIKNQYKGNFYIAGGVFKSFYKDDKKINSDIDLFFSSTEEKQKMISYLLELGGKIVSDKKYHIEINFQGEVYDCIYSDKISGYNLKELLKSFDIGISAIGLEYRNNEFYVEILSEALESIRLKEFNLICPYPDNLNILPTIARLKKYSNILNYSLSNYTKSEIMKIFNKQNKENKLGYSEMKIENILNDLQSNQLKKRRTV